MNIASETSDLWWLSETQASEAWSVGLGHHAPPTDDDQPSITNLNEEEPTIPGWFHSLDEKRNKSPLFKRYPPSSLAEWRSACHETNVYRTLKLFSERPDQEPILGPFLVDIDNQDLINGYSENLGDALIIATETVAFLTADWHLAANSDLRVFFSGRKGFNVEIRPSSLGIHGAVWQQLELSSQKLDEIIAHLRNQNGVAATDSNVVSQHLTQIEGIYGNRRFGYRLKHPYTRLHDSVNKWISKDGSEIARVRLELTVDELVTETISSIVFRAERAS